MKSKLSTILQKLKGFSFFAALKDISIYFSATVAIQALGIISLPVYTYFMDVANYGIANVYNSYALVFGVLLTLNLHSAIARYRYEEKEDFKEFMGTTVISTFSVFAVLSFTIYSFKEAFAEWTNLPVRSIFWLLIYTFCVVIFSMYQNVMVPEKRSKLLSITQVAVHYLKFACALLGFYWIMGESYLGKIIGDFAGMAIMCVVMIYYLYPYVKLSFSFDHLRYILVFSIPLIPYFLGNNILHSFDQWYINANLGHAEAGLYSFAYKIGLLLSGFVIALLNGTNPYYYEWMNRNDLESVNKQVISLTKLLVLATSFLVLFSFDLGYILSAKATFHEALPIVPVIVGGYFFFGIVQLYSRGIYFKKRNIYLTVIILIAGAVNILLNRIYIPQFGYAAAAYTTLAAYVLMLILTILTTRFILKLPPLPLQRMLGLTAMLAVLVVIFFLFFGGTTPNLLTVFSKGILFLIMAGALYYRQVKEVISS